MTHQHPPAVDTPRKTRRWTALILLCVAQFMLIVDITVVQVALPSIGTELDLGRDALTWVVTMYTLFFGGLMILGGRLADAFGARRTLLIGLAIFTVASLACALAPSGELLIGGRAAQGIGAALLSPSALSTITTTFHGADRNRALGIWAAIGGGGAAVGVLVSGLLTAGPGWEWVFLINVPIGLLVLIAIPAVIPATQARVRQSLDIPGAVLVTAATALLIFGLVNAGDATWTSATTLIPLAAALVLYISFVTVERRVANPLMRMSTVAQRPVLSGMFVMLIATGLMLGLFFLTSLYLQHVLEYSALRAGLLFLPIAISITIGAQLASHLISKVGGRIVAVAGFAITAVGAGIMSPLDGVYSNVILGFLIAALGIGPIFVSATTTTLANVPAGEAGVASGAINTFHELGGSIGVAVVSTVAAGSISVGAATTDGFATGFVLCAIVAGLAAVVALVLVPAGKPSAAFVGHGHGH